MNFNYHIILFYKMKKKLTIYQLKKNYNINMNQID